MKNNEVLKLYYNMVANEEIISERKDYVKLLERYTQKEQVLLDMVEDKERMKKILVEMQELEADMHSTYSEQVFIRAFKLGMNLGVEISEKD